MAPGRGTRQADLNWANGEALARCDPEGSAGRVHGGRLRPPILWSRNLGFMRVRIRPIGFALYKRTGLMAADC